MEKIRKVIRFLFEGKITPLSWAASFMSIVAVRLFIDKFLTHSSSPIIEPIMDIHNLLFFLLTFLLIWLFLSLILKEKPFDLAFLFAWAALLVIFPPLFDMVRTGGEAYWSAYLFSGPKELLLQFLTIFGHLPSGIVYFGTKIVFIGGILVISGIIFLKTRKILKAFASAIGSYAIFFLMGAFPSLFFYGYDFLFGHQKLSDIRSFDIASFFGFSQIFGIPIEGLKYSLSYGLNLAYFLLILGILGLFLYLSGKERFWAVIGNFRFPQVIYHSGLLFIGLALGWLYYPDNLTWNIFSLLMVLVLLASVWLAWKASVVFNDIYDFKTDKISNGWRPLQKGLFGKADYFQFGMVIFLLSLLGGFVVSPRAGVLLLIYQILAWFYSAPPYRLKRFPIAATLVSAAASLCVLFLGFVLFSGEENIQRLSWRIILLLMLSYTLCLPIKDFKDIEGDKEEGIWTIPVLFGEEKGRLIVASGFFVSFMASVFFLDDLRLFWWALLFGIAAFFIIIEKRIKPYDLFWWGLGVIALYGLILARIVFF